MYRVVERSGVVDKTNFKKKNEFSSFAAANFNGGMFLPTWTMVDKPVTESEIRPVTDPETYWQHSQMASATIAKQ